MRREDMTNRRGFPASLKTVIVRDPLFDTPCNLFPFLFKFHHHDCMLWVCRWQTELFFSFLELRSRIRGLEKSSLGPKLSSESLEILKII